jgi:CMP-N,N'-diacetyllegionaminic acid synthase
MGDSILVSICARKGSKEIKNKNIIPLAGQPLIVHTIRQALGWGKADRIVVSTDSSAIAAVARDHGAEVPFMRPARLAGDQVGKVAVIRHLLIEAEKIYKQEFSILVDLDVTAPYRKKKDLDACLKIFKRKRPKTLMSGVPCRKNPYFNMVERTPNGRIHICKKPPSLVTSRQKAPQVFEINASIYFYSREYLLDEQNVSALSNDSLIYEMSQVFAGDIDTIQDIKYIEFLIQEGMLKL